MGGPLNRLSSRRFNKGEYSQLLMDGARPVRDRSRSNHGSVDLDISG